MIRFSILDDNEVEAIHQATLRILAETGCGADRAKEPGAPGRMRAPKFERRVSCCHPNWWRDALHWQGRRLTIRGRGGTVKTLGDGNLYFHNLGGAPQVYDAASGTRRLATVQDVRDATRLLDALENCHTITPFFTPTEVPGGVMSLAMYRHALPYTA